MSEAETLECMVDLETLGNGNSAVILSIGACKFLPHGQGVDIHAPHRFEVFVDPQSCVDIGMKMDVSTVLWWMEPERGEARDALMANLARAVRAVPFREDAADGYSPFGPCGRSVAGRASAVHQPFYLWRMKMTNMVPFAQAAVPTFFAGAFAPEDSNIQTVAPLPALSFRGKAWRIWLAGPETLIPNKAGE